jgi:hypothetical protein
MTVLALSATKVTYGDEQVEQLSVTVSPQSSGSMPTGTVTVNESTMTLCTIELSSGKGSCKLSAKKLNAGTYEVLATYAGSANFYGSASAKETFTVATAISKTTLKLSAAKATYGDERVEHLSVAVSPQYPGTTPTGTVTVKASTGTLCVIKLSSGEGSCRLTHLPGPRHLRWQYELQGLNFGQGDTHRRHLMSCRVVGVPATGDR